MNYKIGKKYLIKNNLPNGCADFPAEIRDRKYAVGIILFIRKEAVDVLIDFGRDVNGHAGGMENYGILPSHKRSCWYISIRNIIKEYEESDLEKYLWEDIL